MSNKEFEARERYEQAVNKARMERDKSSMEMHVYSRDPDTREFADAGGDAPGKRLGLKQKESKSNDRMPRIEEGGVYQGLRVDNT